MTLEERIISIIRDQLCISKDLIITLTSNIHNDLGADSLDLFEVIMALEEAFDIDISDEMTENIETMQDVYNIIISTAQIQSCLNHSD